MSDNLVARFIPFKMSPIFLLLVDVVNQKMYINNMSNINSELMHALVEIVWYFGPKTLDGTCCNNLTMPEFIALEKVSHTKNCPVQDIGTKLGFTKSGATRIVNRLEKKGYVKKCKFPDDARVCCITITKSGQLALESAGNICMLKLDRLISGIPVKSHAGIRESLTTMANAIKE